MSVLAKKGYFIVFEGADGAGKSTHVKNLKNYLEEEKARSVFVTAEPTQSALGGMIRDALGGETKRNSDELAALFLADRISHNVSEKNGIEVHLQNGEDVISDRYYYSSLAYQGLESDFKWVADMNLNCPAIRKPDLCIYLDLDPETCFSHIHSTRLHYEIYEKDATVIKNVHDNFMKVFEYLGESENIICIDASRSKEEVDKDIFAIVDAFLKEQENQ